MRLRPANLVGSTKMPDDVARPKPLTVTQGQLPQAGPEQQVRGKRADRAATHDGDLHLGQFHSARPGPQAARGHARVGTCEWCGRAPPPRGSRGPAARYCKPSCRQRAYEARLMAKAIGDPQRSRRQLAANASEAITEVVGRLEVLAAVNEETRSSVFDALESGDVPDYATAYQELFAAVAMLSPAQAARAIDARLGPKS